jgi:hypothetical protein
MSRGDAKDGGAIDGRIGYGTRSGVRAYLREGPGVFARKAGLEPRTLLHPSGMDGGDSRRPDELERCRVLEKLYFGWV